MGKNRAILESGFIYADPEHLKERNEIQLILDVRSGQVAYVSATHVKERVGLINRDQMICQLTTGMDYLIDLNVNVKSEADFLESFIKVSSTTWQEMIEVYKAIMWFHTGVIFSENIHESPELFNVKTGKRVKGYWTDERKVDLIKYTQQYGPKAAAEKFSLNPRTIQSYVSKFMVQLAESGLI